MTVGGATSPRPREQGPPRHAAVAAGLLLLALYAASAATTLVPWDGPEFAAVFATFGLPHPPGTPLVVVWGRSVVVLLHGVAGPELAAAMASGVAAALAGGMLAWLLARRGWTSGAAVGVVAVVGVSATWWTAATEPEAYAPAAALAIAMLAAASEAEQAAMRHDVRTAWGWRVLVVYCALLALAVHQVAWVAGPAAAWLAWPRRGEWRALPWGRMLAAAAVAVSAVGVLVGRGRHAPPMLMGDASTWAGAWDILTRAVYPSPGWWPRQVAFGWQLAMPGQYLLEQFGNGWHWETPGATARTLVLAAVPTSLAVMGARHLWRHDRRLAIAMLLLVLGAFGAAWHLNLKLGPSLGAGWGRGDVAREVRERDSFFIAPLAAWGVLVGTGLVALARGRGWLALACAALWGAAAWSRFSHGRVTPTPGYAARLDAALTSAPRRAVVLAGTDWDAFGLWYAQVARGERRDLTVVTLGLVNEPGYRRRLEQQAPGVLPPPGTPEAAVVAHVRSWAAARGRPLATGPWTRPPVSGATAL